MVAENWAAEAQAAGSSAGRATFRPIITAILPSARRNLWLRMAAMGAIRKFIAGAFVVAAVAAEPAIAADDVASGCITQPSAACIDALKSELERELGTKARFLAEVEQRDIAGARATLARAPADEHLAWLREGAQLLLRWRIEDHRLERRPVQPEAVTAVRRLTCTRFAEAIPAKIIPLLIADPDQRREIYRARLDEFDEQRGPHGYTARDTVLEWLQSDDPVATEIDIELPGKKAGDGFDQVARAIARAQSRWINGDRAGAEADLDRYVWPLYEWSWLGIAQFGNDEPLDSYPEARRRENLSALIFNHRRKSEWQLGVVPGLVAISGGNDHHARLVFALGPILGRAWRAAAFGDLDAAAAELRQFSAFQCEDCAEGIAYFWRDVALHAMAERADTLLSDAIARLASLSVAHVGYSAMSLLPVLLRADRREHAYELVARIEARLRSVRGEERDRLLSRMAEVLARHGETARALEVLRRDPMVLALSSAVLAYLDDDQLKAVREMVHGAAWFGRTPGMQIDLAARLARLGRTEQLAAALDRLDLTDQRAVTGMIIVALRTPAWPIRPVDVRPLGNRLSASKSNDTVAGWVATALAKQGRADEALQWALARPRPEARLHALAAIGASLREPTDCPDGAAR